MMAGHNPQRAPHDLARAQAAFDATAKGFSPLGWHLRNLLKVQRDLVKAWLEDPRATTYPAAAVVVLEDIHRGLQGLLGKKDD